MLAIKRHERSEAHIVLNLGVEELLIPVHHCRKLFCSQTVMGNVLSRKLISIHIHIFHLACSGRSGSVLEARFESLLTPTGRRNPVLAEQRLETRYVDIHLSQLIRFILRIREQDDRFYTEVF